MVNWENDAPRIFKAAKWKEPTQAKYLEKVEREGNKAKVNALREYTGGSSLWFNNYLRGLNLSSLSKSAKATLKNKTRHLNELIRDAPRSKRNVVVFRAVSEKALSRRFQNYRRGADADFLSRGLVSTSIEAAGAWKFIEDDEKCCFLVLLLPKSTAMLEVFQLSQFEYEKEVLLPHGSKFKITKTTVIDGITTFYCVLVGQEI